MTSGLVNPTDHTKLFKPILTISLLSCIALSFVWWGIWCCSVDCEVGREVVVEVVRPVRVMGSGPYR